MVAETAGDMWRYPQPWLECMDPKGMVVNAKLDIGS
jgi:hypothetical protein